MEEINKIQTLQFELIKLASFNSFDGEEVVKSLLENRSLWRGIVMGKDDLIPLRDIEDDYWNVDTLYILSSGEDDDKLLELAEEWCADEYGFLEEKEASFKLGTSHPKGRVLEIWWD